MLARNKTLVIVVILVLLSSIGYTMSYAQEPGANFISALDASDGSPTDVLWVNDEGLVRIGQVGPSHHPTEKLSVLDGGVYIGASNPGAGQDQQITFARSPDGGIARIKVTGDVTNSGYAAGFQFTTTEWTGSNATPRDAMFILPNGNVGIGTTVPSEKLEIKDGTLLLSGSGVASSDTTREIIFARNADGGVAKIRVENFGTTADTPYGAGFKFITSDRTGSDFITREAMKIQANGHVIVPVLEITGGADLAEPFAIAGEEAIKPGMVVVIDPEHPGQLRMANKAYDRMVAGVVSGAGGINPGLTMQQEESGAVGELPISLVGRVYVWADAGFGSIQPGDLLTTSDTPGHAMKVTDYKQAQGTVLGKAMSALHEGQGLVLALITLQ